MIFSGRKLLFIGAHPDDIELGCGAMLAQIAPKADVLCVTLSDNQKNPLLRNVVEEELRSMAVLGVPRDRVLIRQFETRNFPRDRQEILEYLYDLNRQHAPEIVFAHTQADMHQDHAVVTMESLRAFRGTTILGYDVVRSSHGFFPHFLVEVSEQDVARKIQALAQYSTYADKYYFSPETTRSILVRNGALVERPFAEGFDILRIVGRFDSALNPEGPG